MLATHKSPSIIVSAYFKIPSKASHEFYLEHLNRFLTSIKSHIEFFTTSDLVDTLRKMRGVLPIRFHIVDSIDTFEAFKKFGRLFWEKQCYIDSEPYHTPEVAAIWYEKKEFVKKIIAIYSSGDNSGDNSGDSSVSFNKPIIWCDAGCVRDNNWLPIIESFGANTTNIPKDTLLLQTLDTIPQDKVYFNFPDTYIAASIIAGYPKTWNICSELYDNMIIKYTMNNICCNSDQYIWASTVNQNPEMFTLIPAKPCINKWFYFLEYLSL
jgi:hypothetical protein